MSMRSAPARAALASMAAAVVFAFCSAVVLMTTACGIRVSAQDFPVLKLSAAVEPEAPKQ